MRVELENVLGVKEAGLVIAPGRVLAVIGANASGKTSIAVALQALLARDGNPLGVSAAQSAYTYLHDGPGDARAVLIDDDGVITEWFPASGKFMAPGTPPICHREAVGLIDFVANHSARERAALLQGALLPPLDEILEHARRDLKNYLNAKDIDGVMQEIEARGWEMAAKYFNERGLQGKREWSECAGRRWGGRVGADWRPDGWLAEYDGLTVQAAEVQVVDARERLASLNLANAVSQSAHEEAQQARGSLPSLEASLESRETVLRFSNAKLASRKSALDQARNARDKLQKELQRERDNQAQSCPHCGKDLVLSTSGRIMKATERGQIKGIEENLEAAKATYEGMVSPHREASQSCASAQELVNEAKTAIAVCNSNIERGAGVVATPDTERAIATAEAEVEGARQVVKTVTDMLAAQKTHESIMHYTAIAKTLGSTGVRGNLMSNGLKRLNAGFAKLERITGWQRMEADRNGHIMWGSRNVLACSESEKWRAQALTQLTLAAISGASVVVLDRADVLDDVGRESAGRALRAVAESTGMAIVVCLTFKGPIEAAWRLCDEAAVVTAGSISGVLSGEVAGA